MYFLNFLLTREPMATYSHANQQCISSLLRHNNTTDYTLRKSWCHWNTKQHHHLHIQWQLFLESEINLIKQPISCQNIEEPFWVYL